MESFKVSTKGHTDIIDITGQVSEAVKKSKAANGLALVFVAHSTAAVTTIEYESGVIKDIKNILEKIAPEEADYEHHKRWGDHNGAAHIKSAMLGVDQIVPVTKGELVLGTWQQIVLIDFDEKPRERKVIVQIINNGS